MRFILLPAERAALQAGQVVHVRQHLVLVVLLLCNVQEFRFGCGEESRGLLGRSAGLTGLGRGNTSLTVQAYGKYMGVLSNCLPATSSGTGFLDIGPGAPAANARLTPMQTNKGRTFYYVGLTGIKMRGRAPAVHPGRTPSSLPPARSWTPAR